MEKLTIAEMISNLQVLLFKYLFGDIDNFFSSIKCFLQALFSKLISTKWGHFWREMQISKICDEPLNQGLACNIETFEGEKGISIGEVNMVMNRVGIMCELEGNCGKTSFGEEDFVRLFDEEEPSLEEIKETFGVFDVNNDGFIDASELQRVTSKLGFKEGYFELEECKRMIKAFDCNGDGLIDFQEFVKFMEKCLW
ncbi:hypothetical protein BUALT_Bualt17G0071400 [Buddleja alternifolia]|uniref:EF-hand domain-containing protein n=1 Tax=Buddleja alternifolia TaxID=168488 RepID=A0AAV6WDC1_9LAMI|nr:hypothetical protein BUALT_Bualt17G0071400 [Buddleja alternifolia]